MLAFLLVAGSFTTFRRRRLASPTSIVRNRSHAPPCQVPHRYVSVGATSTFYRGPPSFRQGVASRILTRILYSEYSEDAPMPRRRANPLALAVLACLSERPMHPYEMAATMRTRGQDAVSA